MALSLKRACSSLPFSSTPRSLKKCRKNSVNDNSRRSTSSSNLLMATQPSHCVSSSEDESADDSLTEQQLQLQQSRRKAILRRRSSTRSAAETPFNIELSRAVALYSDDDEEDDEGAQGEEVANYPKSRSGRATPTHESKEVSNLSPSAVSVKVSRAIPDSDRAARARCLDYLVSAIDEAWARYCDATTYAEDEEYGYAKTPNSIAMSDNEEDSDASLAETEITDYTDSDFNAVDTKSVSKAKQEQAKQQTSLQHLKDRLTNAKYYLQDFVDSDDFEDCVAFWKRWDMVKYCTIELVEDEDEDDIVENTIDELEDGRCALAV